MSALETVDAACKSLRMAAKNLEAIASDLHVSRARLDAQQAERIHAAVMGVLEPQTLLLAEVEACGVAPGPTFFRRLREPTIAEILLACACISAALTIARLLGAPVTWFAVALPALLGAGFSMVCLLLAAFCLDHDEIAARDASASEQPSQPNPPQQEE